MDARTESTTLNSHLWVPDLVGRIGRAVASKLFKRTLKCILFYQILNTKSMGFFSGVKCLPLKAGLYLWKSEERLILNTALGCKCDIKMNFLATRLIRWQALKCILLDQLNHWNPCCFKVTQEFVCVFIAPLLTEHHPGIDTLSTLPGLELQQGRSLESCHSVSREQVVPYTNPCPAWETASVPTILLSST